MLRKDDPVYYKVKLKELLKEAKNNGIGIKLEEHQVTFENNIGEKASVRI